MIKYICLILCTFISASVNAAPLRYNISGQIYNMDIGETASEEFTGSFVLSDAIYIDYYSNDPTDTRGAYVNYATITGFSLTSSSYSLIQTDFSYYRVAWAPDGTIYGNNTTFEIWTSGGWGETNNVTWYGDRNLQPSSIEFASLYLHGVDPGYVILHMMATAVPNPTSVWLFGSGLLGLIGAAKRRKAA